MGWQGWLGRAMDSPGLGFTGSCAMHGWAFPGYGLEGLVWDGSWYGLGWGRPGDGLGCARLDVPRAMGWTVA
jgi:hypothetical protein